MLDNRLMKNDQIIREVLGATFHNVPWDRNGDAIFAYAQFLLTHGRRPTEDLVFNDFLYRIKSTAEILNPLRVFTTDKEFVKYFIRSEVGDSYNVPTFKIISSEEEVTDLTFDDPVCIKPTHLSGAVAFADKGQKPNCEVMKQWLRSNYYKLTREANYKELKPKIIVEPILFNDRSVNDYKIFCFDGSPRIVQVDIGRRARHTRNFFNLSWKEMGVTLAYPRSDIEIRKPTVLDEMLDVASKLSRNFSLVRIDFYCHEKEVYVGEITHCHGAACERFANLDQEFFLSRQIFV